MDTVIRADDEVIVLAEDDLLIRLDETRPAVMEPAIAIAYPQPPEPERTLLIGWNHRASKIIDLLDDFVEPGSVLTIAAQHPDPRHTLKELVNLTVAFTACDPTDRTHLEPSGWGHTSTSSCSPTPATTPTKPTHAH
ncbi:hypothetical protein [Actinomadura sp. HBU206391]|uniref:hypothetical protein n=1 Tax=Actinomadura sp. HBU206391 TaxID=2731692 RepID=UPI0021C73DCB|nr:hypothetical protein [Actinomadura sp. HBU206391]